MFEEHRAAGNVVFIGSLDPARSVVEVRRNGGRIVSGEKVDRRATDNEVIQVIQDKLYDAVRAELKEQRRAANTAAQAAARARRARVSP